jgi:hypothetical protein
MGGSTSIVSGVQFGSDKETAILTSCLETDRDLRPILRASDGPPFQSALAMADELPEALIAPTGAGKTAAAILGTKGQACVPKIRWAVVAGTPTDACHRQAIFSCFA